MKSASIILIVLGVAGCTLPVFGSRHPRSPEYAVGFTNRTGEELREVRVEWTYAGESYAVTGGIFSPGTAKVFHDAPDPIPPSATLAWTDSSGKEHHQAVELSKAVKNSKTWSGTIWIRMAKDGVRVIPLTWDEDQGVAGSDYP